MRVIFANLWCLNPCPGRALDALAKHDPDLIAVAELAPRQFGAMTARLPEHPHVLAVPTDRRCTLVLFSRWPLAAPEVVNQDACRGRPFAKTRVNADHPCTVLLAHTTAPFTPAMAARRDAQIRQLAATAADVQGPLILLGDLNANHASAPVRGLTEASRLVSPRRGPRHHRTWPSVWPWRSYDHVMHSADFEVDDFRALSARGSDHRPLLATFRLRPDC